jgi:nucleoside-diphosphate-sugar epimerase
MRFDLTINEFVKELYTNKKLLVFGEQFWRPYCHVIDFAQAYISVLDAPKELVSYNVYNVGDTSENYTKQMIVDKIKEKINGCSISYVKKVEDPRDYRVNSDKIKKELGFTISMTLEDGIEEIICGLKKNSFGKTDNQKYYNIPFKI